ncbi:MAG: hypothetical protein NTX25_10525, partial [Proteobacteria bacterium]|nr:hypothetical protein [Pseudomonadota bacterium]
MRQSIVSSLVLMIMSSVLLSCGPLKTHSSQQHSDWEGPAAEDASRTYVVDWACEPKQYGSDAEKDISMQEEYCEWKSEKLSDTEKTCRFTSSFDNSRDFYLNSRKQTEFNSIFAAQELRDNCSKLSACLVADKKSEGHLCTGVDSDNCVRERNSDPEICDKLRWVTKENYNGNLNFSIAHMPAGTPDFSPEPLVQLGLLATLPENCHYTKPDKTEVACTIPIEDECYSMSGQLRAGIQVETKKFSARQVNFTDKQCKK